MSKQLNRSLSQLSKFLDPFLVLGIFVLFAIPVITVMNLTPGKRPTQEQSYVLGTTDQSTVSFTANSTAANGIAIEKFTRTTDDSYTMQVQLLPHLAGTYRNTLFTAINGKKEEKKIQVSANFESVAPNTKISIVVDDVKFVILDEDGTMYPPTLYIMPQDTMLASIEVESSEQVNFVTGFSLDLSVE